MRSQFATTQVDSFLVEAGEAGGSFGELTVVGLYRAKALVAFCTEDYGAETGAGYETYRELEYAHQQKLRIIPVQLSEVFPPEPADERGRAQNAFVLRTDLLRISDIGMQDPEAVAEKLRKAWAEMAQ